MDADNNGVSLRNFIIKIILIDILLLFLAALLSFAASLNFWKTVLILGIVTGGIGAFLGSPPLSTENLHDQKMNLYVRPSQVFLDQPDYDTRHAAPRYALENVMAFGGLIAIGLSILFQILIATSK
jgi:hypothetical protein